MKGFGCRPDHDDGYARAGRRRKASRGGNRGSASATVEVVAALWGFGVATGGGQGERAVDAGRDHWIGPLRRAAGRRTNDLVPQPRG